MPFRKLAKTRRKLAFQNQQVKLTITLISNPCHRRVCNARNLNQLKIT
jgi:hypothetical protein